MKFLFQAAFVILFFSNFAFAKQFNIVVTVPYLKDLIENITCQSLQYKTDSLIPVGVDPHTYTLVPNDRVRLKKADLILQIGAGLEPWLDKIQFDNTQNRLILSQHLTLNNIQRGNEKTRVSELIYDPHIWQSPQLTEDAVNTILQTLVNISPQNKNTLGLCTKNYINKIHATVKELKKQISVLPKENRVFATNHDSLRYFATAFDFKIYTILGLSDEEQPSLSQLKNLITTLQQQHIKSIFLESTGNTKNIQTVSKNAHVRIGGKLYVDSFGEKGSGADTTLGMWQTNVSTLIGALK